jgi:membrane-associated protease RseP (regulator of RpoE activity)
VAVLGVIAFVLAVLFSIAMHEVGHLVPAKKFGVKVTQYMVGFGPTLWSRMKGETEVGIKAIPLGGYIRMIGMMPPAAQGHVDKGPFAKVVTEARLQSTEEIEPGEEDRAFYKLNPGRKIVVMLGGPTMNLMLALVFLAISLGVIGIPQSVPKLYSVVACVPTQANPEGVLKPIKDPNAPAGTPKKLGCPDSSKTPAAAAGLQKGDTIVSIDGKPVKSWDDATAAIAAAGAGSVAVVYERNGVKQSVTADLVAVDRAINPGDPKVTKPKPFLGVSPDAALVRQPITQVPATAWHQISGTVAAIVTLPVRVYEIGKSAFTNTPRDPNGLVGLVGVARVSSEVANAKVPAMWRVSEFLLLIAGLNLALWLFNLIPLLPLDGGHVAGATWEAIRARIAKRKGRPNPGPVDVARLLPIAYVVGAFLIGMSVLILYADIVKPLRIG